MTAFSIATAIGIGAFVLVPVAAVRWLAFIAVCLLAGGAVVAGVERWSPVRRSPWWFAAAGITLAGCGGAATELHRHAGSSAHDVTFGELLVPLGYVLLVIGTLQLTRAKRPGRDVDTLLDGAILGCAVFIVAWLFVLAPAITGSSGHGWVLLTSSFVVFDLMLVVFVGRLATTAHVAATRSFQLILAGLVVGIVGDAAYLVRGISGSIDDGIVTATSLVAFACVGAAALHRDMVVLSEPVPAVQRAIHPARIGLFAVAACLPPIVFTVTNLDGADQYVVGGASLVLSVLVVLRLAGLIRRREQELSAREVLERRLEFGATHDALTGLGNRAWFTERLDHALAVAARSGNEVGLLFIDLDNFKTVNDAFGHLAGDRALVHLGARILATVRESDLVARFGGDEYVVALEVVNSLDDAIDAARRVALALRPPIDLDGTEVALTATIGVSTTAEGSRSGEALLRDADAALYEGKQRGRNTVIVCDETLRERVEERLRVETDLRGAAARGELRLLYQPELDLHTGELFGVEALVRWQHPVKGLLSPDRFLPIAERSGLISEVGAWVIAEACRQRAAWQRTLGVAQAPVISINVSPAQLARGGVAGELLACLAANELAPSAIRVEVTETAVLADTETTAEALRAISEAGIEIAVDDFGTGYFSLSDLVRYPIDIIKVDQTFVRGLGDGGTEEAIVVSTLRLAQTLGRTVIAEGVETTDQADCLRRLGCEVGQGYLFSRPVAPEQIEQLRAATHA